MENGELFISCHDGAYAVRVAGRATFECAPALRSLAKTLEQENFREIRFDLSKCLWMDSTFMGILAMIALRAKKIGADAVVVNAGPQNTGLLCGLGLKKLFRFAEGEAASEDGPAWTGGPASASGEETGTMAQSARTVLDAHETLMDVDAANVKKFSGVVNLVKKELSSSSNDAPDGKKEK